MKWLVDFIDEKIQFASFDQSNETSVIDLKMNKSNFDEKPFYDARDVFFFAKLRRGSYSVPIAKAASQKIGALIRL